MLSQEQQVLFQKLVSNSINLSEKKNIYQFLKQQANVNLGSELLIFLTQQTDIRFCLHEILDDIANNAANLIKQENKAKLLPALYQLAMMHLENKVPATLSFEKRSKLALSLLNIGEKENYAPALFELAYLSREYKLPLHYSPEGRQQYIFNLFKRAAEQDHVEAHFQLGKLYQSNVLNLTDNQEGFNDKLAFQHYKKAAEQDHLLAQEKITNIYAGIENIALTNIETEELGDKLLLFSVWLTRLKRNILKNNYPIGIESLQKINRKIKLPAKSIKINSLMLERNFSYRQAKTWLGNQDLRNLVFLHNKISNYTNHIKNIPEITLNRHIILNVINQITGLTLDEINDLINKIKRYPLELAFLKAHIKNTIDVCCPKTKTFSSVKHLLINQVNNSESEIELKTYLKLSFFGENTVYRDKTKHFKKSLQSTYDLLTKTGDSISPPAKRQKIRSFSNQ